ncbi:uncharacterized protein LOC125030712 [Penaeus chinensis]|uniref:uncharacterized protein LOC125030712 n=1 Tax=Penaeus chinensis TaxID=139456 RepID=UPI001FB5F966|nr:uncharacterized protein LOC125030712 [Penaeus chinensis]
MCQSTSACVRMRRQLAKYKSDLIEWEREHRQLADDLRRMRRLNEEMERLLRWEREDVERLQQEGINKTQQLRAARRTLIEVCSSQDTFDALNHGDFTQDEAEDWMVKCRETFPDVDTVRKSVKVRTATSKAVTQMFRETKNCSTFPLTPAEERYSDIISLADIFPDHNADHANSLTDPDPSAEESVSECLTLPQESVSDSLADEVVSEPIPVADDFLFEVVRVESSEADLVPMTDGEDADGGEGAQEDSTILQKIRHIKFTATVDLTAENLSLLREPVRAMLEAGEVYVVQEGQRCMRSAKLSLREDMICLHHLQEKHPPALARTIPYCEVQAMLDYTYALTFLELAWPGSPPRRVYIRLSPDSGRGRQFVMLCSGERGHSYANTNFLRVKNKGLRGECLQGGDYNFNSGLGGYNIIPGLACNGEYKRRDVTGSVGAVYTNAQNGAQFYIRTRGRPAVNRFTVFGQVEKGLEVAAAAIALQDVKKVMVVDCGVVVPHIPQYPSGET